MKIKVTVSTNKVGSESYRTIEIDDDTAVDEIDEIAMETMWELISWNWKRIV